MDLLIRSGGEQRLSDFLLWESAYAEFVFTDRLWPDFDEGDLEAALEDFSCRERRFGGVAAAAVLECRNNSNERPAAKAGLMNGLASGASTH